MGYLLEDYDVIFSMGCPVPETGKEKGEEGAKAKACSLFL